MGSIHLPQGKDYDSLADSAAESQVPTWQTWALWGVGLATGTAPRAQVSGFKHQHQAGQAWGEPACMQPQAVRSSSPPCSRQGIRVMSSQAPLKAPLHLRGLHAAPWAEDMG